MKSTLPEPLLRFDPPSAVLLEALAGAEPLFAHYRDARNANRILPNTLEALRVELTYHSNALEGSTLSLRDTQLIVEGREPNTGKALREIYEARNHDRALRMIETWAGTRTNQNPITERDLLDVHAQILTEIDPARAGEYRTDRVLITGTRFVPPGSHKFAELVPALIALANGTSVHPVVHAAELHYNFVAIHPFADGNGRTARLMMNYRLMRDGFPAAVIPVERRSEYLNCLESGNGGNWEPFVQFVLDCSVASIRRVIGEDGR